MKYVFWSLTLALCFITNFSQGQPQLQKWYMNYFEVDFSGATPQFSSLPAIHASNMGASPNRLGNIGNGIHDGFGNLVFYTVWDNTNPVSVGYRHQIYNSSGNLIGNITVEADAHELSIVPYGNLSPDKYLIIYSAQRGAGATRYLDYVIIDMAANGGQGSMSVGYEIVAAGAGSPTPASAVGKPQVDGTRHLYVSVKDDIQKYVIDFTLDMMGFPELVISPATVPVVYSFSQNLYLSELDLSPDGTKLALGETWENDVHVLELDANGDFSSVQSYAVGNAMAFNEYIAGIEFDASGDKLFSNLSRPNNCPPAADEGIYVIDLLSSMVSSGPIGSSEEYSRSNLEMAYDGYLYAGGYFKDVQESRLARIDPVSETILAEYVVPDILPYVGDYRGYSCSPAYPGFFTLPDQVDGETVVGLREVAKAEEIKLFPNPANDRITLSLPENFKEEELRFSIYDALGQSVAKQVYNESTGQASLVVKHLPAGLYTIIAWNGESYGIGKFIKY